MAQSTEKTFDKLSAICLALPAAQCTRSGDHATYRVRGKVFAYFLDDHHGDGIVSVCVKSELGENNDRARLDPERYLSACLHRAARLVRDAPRPRPSRRGAKSRGSRAQLRLTAPKTLLRKIDADSLGKAGH